MSTASDAQELIKELCSCIPRDFFSRIEETQKGIGFILIYLNKAEHEVFAGDLARELGVSTARIAALLKKMEKNDLIVRYDSAQDARKTVVEITEEGKSCLSKLKEYVLRKAELMLEKIGKKDMEEFLRIYHKINKVLEEDDNENMHI